MNLHVHNADDIHNDVLMYMHTSYIRTAYVRTVYVCTTVIGILYHF